jgi:hypothetical protein
MSYLHLSRTRTRERSPSPPLRSIIRRDTKRSRLITLSDDEDDGHDDYPYSLSHRPVKPSRALTIRNQPSQIERYNIWSDRNKSEDRDLEEDKTYERSRLYRHTSRHRHHHDHSDDDYLKSDPEERAFRLKVDATFSRPRPTSSHYHHHESHLLPSNTFRRKEKYVDEGWETRERSRSRSHSREFRRRDSFWGDGGFWGDCEAKKDEGRDSEDEKWSRYRKIKRTKTEEWSPLTGWRRV